MAVFLKDPAAVLEHVVDWAAGYLDGQDIVGSTWEVVPEGGLMLSGAAMAEGRTMVTLTGGVRGGSYRVINRVTLSDGGTDERSLVVRVEDR